MPSTENLPPSTPETASLVPANAREHVTIAPPGDWVSVCDMAETPATATFGAFAILLLDRQYHAAQGARYERVVRLLCTTSAAHDAAQWKLDFDPASQRVIIHSITVRRDGQKREHALSDRLRIVHRDDHLARPDGTGRVTAIVSLDDVRVGDIVDVSVTVQTRRVLLAENFSLFCCVPTSAPLHAFHLSVRYPHTRPLRWKASEDGFAPVFHKRDEDHEWHWNLREVSARDVEPGVPPWHLVDPWLQISDCETWENVASGFANTWREQLDESELIEAARQIATAVAAPAERVDRALTLVQDEIRLLPLDTGLFESLPASPGTVLRRRAGDCREKALLAVILLRRLGVSARPVLVHTVMHQTIDSLLPMPDAFDHVVVEYEVAGKRRWADVTLTLQGGGGLHRHMPEYRLGLPIGPNVAGLERLTVAANLSDHYELRESFSVDTAGRPSTLKVMVTATGADAEELRRVFAHDGLESVARDREQFYRQIFPDLRRLGALEWRDDRPRNEFRLAEMFEVRGVTVPGRDPQSCVFEYRTHLIQAVLGFSDMGARKQPFGLRFPCHLHHWIEVESPALEGGPGRSTPGRDLAFRFSCDFNEQYGRVVSHYSLRTLADAVKAERFEQFKTRVREIWPSTFLQISLPLGLGLPKRNRAVSSLLPAAPPARRNKAGNDPAAGNSAPGDLTLPMEPAPALIPTPGSTVESVPAPIEESIPLPETPAPPKRIATPRSSAAFSDPTATDLQPRGRRRRRRSRRFQWRKLIQIAVFAIIALLVILVLIIANLRKG